MAGFYSVIRATGSYIPEKTIPNSHFLEHWFYDDKGSRFEESNEYIIKKFEDITGIRQRRYVADNLLCSDIAFFSAENALEDTDKESLDCIIVAHNFGDIRSDNRRTDLVPSIAARVKNKLKIKNPKTIAYDLPFGCPGWLQGAIHADYYIKSGDAKRILVIGAETLSRISDQFDRDSMIYADGAGAAVLESVESENPVGILSHVSESHTESHSHMLQMDKSRNPNYENNELFLKMSGHKLYEFALKHVPVVVRESIEKAGLSLNDIDKILLHQANEKMDYAILRKLFGLYGEKQIPPNIMPMTISWLGNSSVATLPTLLDLMFRGEIENQCLKSGNNIVLASVGAGMNINSVVYRIP